MANGKVTGGTAVASSGTSVALGSALTVSAGNLVICTVILLPSTLTSPTFSKSAGTCTIGSFLATNKKSVNGNALVYTNWCSVTTSGTLTISVAAGGTITNALLLVEVYSGASGIGNVVNGSGNTGTSQSITLTPTYANSWIILITGAVTSTALTGGLGTTLEQATLSNITGTSNDLSGFIGSDETADSAGVSKAVVATQPSGATWAGMALELVNQFKVAGSAGTGGSKSTVGSGSKSAAGNVAASSTRVGGMLKSAAAGVSGTTTETVPTNNKAAATGTSSAASVKVNTNLRAGSSAAASLASKVASSVKSTSAGASASSTRVGSSVKSVTGNASAVSSRVGSSVKVSTGHVGAAAVVLASSKVSASTRTQGSANASGGAASRKNTIFHEFVPACLS